MTAKLINAYPMPTTFGIVQQPGHDPDPHAGLESVRRARRSHAKRPEQLPRPLFLVEDVDDQPVHVRSRPASRFVESRRPRQRGHLRGSFRSAAQSTQCSAGCMCSRRVCFWIRAPATTTSISNSRRPTSSPGDQLGEQLGVPNANQQDGQDGIPIFSPANYTGIGHSRSLPIFRHEKTFQCCDQPDLCRRQAHDQGRFRPAAPAHGRIPDQPRQRPLQLLAEHHQQPGEQHGRPRRWRRFCSARRA